MTWATRGSRRRNEREHQTCKQQMTDEQSGTTKLRRCLLSAVLTAAVVAFAGFVAKESLLTIVVFSISTAVLVWCVGYWGPTVEREPERSPDLDWIRWILGLLGRRR